MSASEDLIWIVDKMRALIGTLYYSQDYDKRTNIPGGYCDCSGLVWWLFNQRGYSIGTWTGTQKNDGVLIKSGGGGAVCSSEGMNQGDIVLFDWNSTSYTDTGHVEIYMGNGQICGHGGDPDPGPSMKSLVGQTAKANAWQVRRIIEGGISDIPKASGSTKNGVWSGVFYTPEADRATVVRGFITLIERRVVDPTGQVISSNEYLTLEQMAVNARYIYQYLSARGWSKSAICGLLGNMQRESSINPGIWQNLVEGNYSGGYGLVQWTPATKYTNWADANGYSIGDIKGQLYWIDNLTGSSGEWLATSAYALSFDAFKISNESPEWLASAFMCNFERPGEPAEAERRSNARYWHDNL